MGELRHEAPANCLKQPIYVSGNAVSSWPRESTVVPSVWAKVSKEMKLEANPTRMFIINFAPTISCFLPLVDLGSWFCHLRIENTYGEPNNINPDALCICA